MPNSGTINAYVLNGRAGIPTAEAEIEISLEIQSDPVRMVPASCEIDAGINVSAEAIELFGGEADIQTQCIIYSDGDIRREVSAEVSVGCDIYVDISILVEAEIDLSLDIYAYAGESPAIGDFEVGVQIDSPDPDQILGAQANILSGVQIVEDDTVPAELTFSVGVEVDADLSYTQMASSEGECGVEITKAIPGLLLFGEAAFDVSAEVYALPHGIIPIEATIETSIDVMLSPMKVAFASAATELGCKLYLLLYRARPCMCTCSVGSGISVSPNVIAFPSSAIGLGCEIETDCVLGIQVASEVEAGLRLFSASYRIQSGLVYIHVWCEIDVGKLIFVQEHFGDECRMLYVPFENREVFVEPDYREISIAC